MKLPEKRSVNPLARANLVPKPGSGRIGALIRKENSPLEKPLAGAIVAAVLFCAGFFLGLRHEKRRSCVAIEILNQSVHAIMTVTVRHQNGSVIAANIKKNHKQRIRFLTKGQNTYSLTITFDNNKTIYSKFDRVIHNGETIRETVTDSIVTAEKET
jgi:multisubunit Na+/H+ antiporter MnhC subunit